MVFLIVGFLAIATAALTLADQPALKEPIEGLVGDAVNILSAVVTGMVGALVVSKRPGNRIGWLMLVAGVCLLFSQAVGQYAVYALVIRPGSLPGGLLIAWIAGWAWTPQVALLALLLLWYPTGSYISPRWRLVAWAAFASIAIFSVTFSFIRVIFVGGAPDAPLATLKNPI